METAQISARKTVFDNLYYRSDLLGALVGRSEVEDELQSPPSLGNKSDQPGNSIGSASNYN